MHSQWWYTKKPSVNYNKRFKRLDTQLNDSTYENSRKVHKVVMPTNKKTLIKNFGDKCNKQTNVPFLPAYSVGKGQSVVIPFNF